MIYLRLGEVKLFLTPGCPRLLTANTISSTNYLINIHHAGCWTLVMMKPNVFVFNMTFMISVAYIHPQLGHTTKMLKKCAHIPVVTCVEKYFVFGDKSQLGFPIISPASLSPIAMTLLAWKS